MIGDFLSDIVTISDEIKAFVSDPDSKSGQEILSRLASLKTDVKMIKLLMYRYMS